MNENPYTCPEVLAKLETLMAGGLAAEDAAHVGAHLETCGSCREALRLQEAVSRLVRRADARPAPPELRRQVLDALAEEDGRRPD